VCKLNGLYTLINRTCGEGQIVPLDCGDPLCPDCEKRRSAERRAHWRPVFEAMRNPRMITLTIRNGSQLKERIGVLQSSFRKLLDFRYGSRNLARLEKMLIPFLAEHYQRLLIEGEITEIEADNRLAKFKMSALRFEKEIYTFARKSGKNPRMRDLIGEGFATLEITCSQDAECWHVHRHLCVDGYFIPWPILACVWRIVTEGNGEIVDIRAMDNTYQRSINEVTKYLAKAWDIPHDKKNEFRGAVRGLKRIWALGGAKPVIEPNICPFCQDPACRGRMIDTGEAFQQGKLDETELLKVRSITDGSLHVFAREIEKGWRRVPLSLIPKDFAWHSLKEHAP
jgi:hypothetical protein